MQRERDVPRLDLSALDEHRVPQRAVEQLVTSVGRSLKAVLVGIYFGGSFALGEFDPARSDTDLVVVTQDPLSDSAAVELAAVHAGFA